FLPTPSPPSSPLFPYTTLFRSQGPSQRLLTRRPCQRSTRMSAGCSAACSSIVQRATCNVQPRSGSWHGLWCRRTASARGSSIKRSEEHTSELQSLAYLVCRLLL